MLKQAIEYIGATHKVTLNCITDRQYIYQQEQYLQKGEKAQHRWYVEGGILAELSRSEDGITNFWTEKIAVFNGISLAWLPIDWQWRR